MSLINNISNETTMLWRTITKPSVLSMPDADAEDRNNIVGIYNFVQLRSIQQGAEFFSTLSNDIQLFVESQ